MTTVDDLNARVQGYLPGLIGIEFIRLKPGRLATRLHSGRTTQVWDSEVKDEGSG
jgi:acyl-coenzyme A thioesterase PaaI-like protein